MRLLALAGVLLGGSVAWATKVVDVGSAAGAARQHRAVHKRKHHDANLEAKYRGEDPCNHDAGGCDRRRGRKPPAAPSKLTRAEVPFEQLEPGEDDYWVRQATSGKVKRRVIRQPPPAELKSATNSATGKQERTWTFSTAQTHVHFKPGERNPFCHQKDDWFGSENEGGKCSWFMVQEFLDISELPPSQIVAWRAKVTRSEEHFPSSPDRAIVHHMDLFPCTAGIDKRFPPVTSKEPHLWDGADVGAACDQIFFAYDRDAFSGYDLPHEAGFAIGKGTPYTRLLMQWHYVLPPCEGSDGPVSCHPYHKGIVFGGAPVVSDHSGFELTLTPDLRKHNAATIPVIDPNIMYDWGAPKFLYSFETTDFGLERMLAHDFEKYGELTPFAMHLHQHDHGVEMWTSHLRGKQRAKVGEYGRFLKYGGGERSTVADFGQGETFMDLAGPKTKALPGRFAEHPGAAGLPFRKGDNLRVNCVMDTKHRNIWDHAAKEEIRYGMFTGQEMCGILLMYYPHDASRQFWHGSLLANVLDLRGRATCYEWETTPGKTTGRCVKRKGHKLFEQKIDEGALEHELLETARSHNPIVAAARKEVQAQKLFDVGGVCPRSLKGAVCDL